MSENNIVVNQNELKSLLTNVNKWFISILLGSIFYIIFFTPKSYKKNWQIFFQKIQNKNTK